MHRNALCKELPPLGCLHKVLQSLPKHHGAAQGDVQLRGVVTGVLAAGLGSLNWDHL